MKRYKYYLEYKLADSNIINTYPKIFDSKKEAKLSVNKIKGKKPIHYHITKLKEK